MTWRELFFYRKTAKENMLASFKPKYSVFDLYGHTSRVTCVTSSWNTIFSADDSGVILVWNLADGKLQQTLRVPLPVRQLLAPSKFPGYLIACGEHPQGSGAIYVWEKVSHNNQVDWVPRWSRSYFRRRDESVINVTHVEHLTLCSFGSGHALLTSDHTPVIQVSLRFFLTKVLEFGKLWSTC